MPQLVGKEVGPVGFGIMNLTWRPDPVPNEQAFAVLRAALDAGMNFWNAGEFYGTPECNSLTLLAAYFEKYPEDADKVVLSVKGGVRLADLTPDGSPEIVRRSLDNILRLLQGRKKLDIFECARRDRNTPLATTFGVINDEYVKAGKVGGICLSEVSAATIDEAVAITNVVGVEVELSLATQDPLKNGIADACARHNLPLIAYSPFSRGLLSGRFRSAADAPPKTDVRSHLPRFQGDNFEKNLQLARQIEQIAAQRGAAPAQIALGWLLALQRRAGLPTILPIPGGTTVERIQENGKVVDLSDKDLEEIEAAVAKYEVAGTRYPAGAPIDT